MPGKTTTTTTMTTPTPTSATGRSRPQTTYITKFTNCRILKPDATDLIEQDLWIDSRSGKILRDQVAFYELHLAPDEVIDLGGRILAPGLIDVQLNGAQGFDFSVPQGSRQLYDEGLRVVNRGLAATGVTSYLPTVVSSTPEVYWEVLPSLAPSGSAAASRRGEDGAESLGAHVEGPFINPGRNGIHSPEVLRASHSWEDVVHCYGESNLVSAVKMITAAPELGDMTAHIPRLVQQGIVFSIGHSDATYEQGLVATRQGASMVTHLFNAMRPFEHRNPGIFGLLGQSQTQKTKISRPFYGVIADGIHLHPTSIKIAYNAHPHGLVLVTDAMRLCGLPDGVYDWTNGDRIVKSGAKLTLEGSEKIAGSSATLIECVNNFLRWSNASVADALRAVTATPARMLGLQRTKGSLDAGADADLVVLGESSGPDRSLTVDQVWKFGVKIHDGEK